MDDIDRLLRQRSMDDVSGLSGGGSLGSSMASNQEPNRTYRVRDEDHGRSEDTQRDLTPMSMVRKRSPYADIPSLYDMYVQAAPRDREPERFGTGDFPQWNAGFGIAPDGPAGRARLRSRTGRWAFHQSLGRCFPKNGSPGGSGGPHQFAGGRSPAGKWADSGRSPGIGAAGACAPSSATSRRMFPCRVCGRFECMWWEKSMSRGLTTSVHFQRP